MATIRNACLRLCLVNVGAFLFRVTKFQLKPWFVRPGLLFFRPIDENSAMLNFPKQSGETETGRPLETIKLTVMHDKVI